MNRNKEEIIAFLNNDENKKYPEEYLKCMEQLLEPCLRCGSEDVSYCAFSLSCRDCGLMWGV